MANLYEILQVSQNANPEEIQAAYARRQQALASDRTAQEELNKAYRILNDPKKRQEYDAQQAANLQQSNQQNFNLARLQVAIKEFSPQGTITEIPQKRPSWAVPPPAHSSSSLPMIAEGAKLTPGKGQYKQYEYVRDASDPNSGRAILSLTEPSPTIQIDLSKPENMAQHVLAAVELAKASGASKLLIPETTEPEIRAELEKCCTAHKLEMGTYSATRAPEPKPAPVKNKEQQELQARHTPTLRPKYPM